MRVVALIVAVLVMAGCDRTLPEPVQTANGLQYVTLSEAAVVKTTVVTTHRELFRDVDTTDTCQYSGVCFGCGWTYTGEFTCGPAFRPYCDGTQSVKVDKTVHTYYHEYTVTDKAQTHIYRSPSHTTVTTTNVRPLSSCG